MAHDIQTEIEIDASAQRVWDVLTDSAALRDWNPVLTRLDGELSVGNKIRVDIRTAGRKLPLKVRLTAATPAESLEWVGGPRFIFRACHGFRIHALSDARVRFVHYETFEGITVPLLSRILAGLERDYDRMNAALKTRAEA